MKKKKKGFKGSLNQAQRVALALAFVGEHKEQFEKWVKSKGGEVKHDC